MTKLRKDIEGAVDNHGIRSTICCLLAVCKDRGEGDWADRIRTMLDMKTIGDIIAQQDPSDTPRELR